MSLGTMIIKLSTPENESALEYLKSSFEDHGRTLLPKLLKLQVRAPPFHGILVSEDVVKNLAATG